MKRSPTEESSHPLKTAVLRRVDFGLKDVVSGETSLPVEDDVYEALVDQDWNDYRETTSLDIDRVLNSL